LFVTCFANNAFAGTLNLGPFGQGVFTGTEPFNTTDACHEPGDDCGSDDSRVRTADLVQFVWSIAADDFRPGERDFASVVFEQTIQSSAHAEVHFDRIPTVCLAPPAGPGGGRPKSSLINHADGSQTLMCNLGSMGAGSQKSFSVPVRPSANSRNGTSFTSTQLVYALDATNKKITSDAVYSDVNTYSISAAPAFDLMADRREMYQGETTVSDVGNGPEPGYVVHLSAHIAADATRRGKGVESLTNDVQFQTNITATRKDGVSSLDLPYKILSCQPNTVQSTNTVFGSEDIAGREPLTKKVVDSGDCTFSGNHSNGYNFLLNGIDSRGTRYPDETSAGLSLVNGPFFVAAYEISLFVPFSAIEASDGDLSGNGGAVNITSCFSDFDPVSHSGVSNYASNVEPGFNGSAMLDGSGSNNCSGPVTLQLSTGGGFNHRLVSTVNDAGEYQLAPLVDIAHTGATTVETGTAYAHMESFSNTGSEMLDNFHACFRFDNTVSTLTSADLVGASAGKYAFIAQESVTQEKLQGVDASHWRVEYGTANYSPDSTMDRDGDGIADFNAATGRYEGNWDTMRQATCTTDLAANWSTNPNDIGLENINVVRFVPKANVGSVKPGQKFRAFLPLQMRDVFYGGLNDGQPIPVGTVAAAVSSFRSDQFYPNWRPVQYNPSPESSQGDGDRVTFSRVSVQAVLSTHMPKALPGVTESVLAGNEVTYKIKPSVISKLPAGGLAKRMRVVTELSAGSTYNAECTAAIQTEFAPSLIRYNKPLKGQQTLTWEIG